MTKGVSESVWLRTPLAVPVLGTCLLVQAVEPAEGCECCVEVQTSEASLEYIPDREPYFMASPQEGVWPLSTPEAMRYCELVAGYLREGGFSRLSSRFSKARKLGFGLTISGQRFVYLQFEPDVGGSENADDWPVWGVLVDPTASTVSRPFVGSGFEGRPWYREGDANLDGFGILPD